MCLWLEPSCITLAHIFSHNVDRLLGHNSVQLDQLLVPQFFHDLCFLKEGLWRHGARL